MNKTREMIKSVKDGNLNEAKKELKQILKEKVLKRLEKVSQENG